MPALKSLIFITLCCLAADSMAGEAAMLQYWGYKDTSTLPSNNSAKYGNYAVISTGPGFVTWGFTRTTHLNQNSSVVCAPLFGSASGSGTIVNVEAYVRDVKTGKTFLSQSSYDNSAFNNPVGKHILETKFDSPYTGDFAIECRAWAFKPGLVVYRQLMIIANSSIYSHVSNGQSVRIASGASQSGGFSLLALNSNATLAAGLETWGTADGFNTGRLKFNGFANVEIPPYNLYYKVKVDRPDDTPTLILVKKRENFIDWYATTDWAIAAFSAYNWAADMLTVLTL